MKRTRKALALGAIMVALTGCPQRPAQPIPPIKLVNPPPVTWQEVITPFCRVPGSTGQFKVYDVVGGTYALLIELIPGSGIFAARKIGEGVVPGSTISTSNPSLPFAIARLINGAWTQVSAWRVDPAGWCQ
jgi:hypothetical protein